MNPRRWIFLALVSFLSVASATEDNTPALSWSALKGIDLAGKLTEPGESDGVKAIAFVFLSHECPISNQYVTELNRIYKETAGRGVEFYGVVSDRTVSRQRASQFVEEFKIGFPVIFDAAGGIADALKPTHVPEAFVLNAMGRIKYRGRIDDLFTDNLKRRQAATKHDLLDAITTIKVGASPATPQTTPIGCKRQPSASPSEESVTFNRDVAPILHAHCAVCHREGEVAPFPLLSFDDASKRADFLVEVVSKKRMPPWTTRAGFGHFMGERRLSDHDIAVLTAWVKGGVKKGDAADLPAPPNFAAGWMLGTPDLIVEMKDTHTVPATGPDQNRFFVIPIDIPENKIVVGAQFIPGNPRVVHHAIMYLDTSGAARKRDEATPEPGFEGFVATFRGGVLGFWAPGYTPRFYPENVGDVLHRGTDMALQLHYHPSGKEETDRSKVGIYFADKPVDYTLGGLALINFDVDIPAGEGRHKITHTFTTPTALRLIDVVPHMHLIGKEMKVTATLPDGNVVPLIWSDWDFNWQDVYRFREIVELPEGTRIDLEAYYDNTADNPYNPSQPPKRIGFGEMTTDEMCICALRLIQDPKDDRRVLSQAIRNSMQEQMKNPKVLINVTRFMMSGDGGSRLKNLKKADNTDDKSGG